MYRLLGFMVVFIFWLPVSRGQDKPPVAVDDTVYFPVTSEPLPYEIMVYPLANDYSQDMNPIEIVACSGYPVINDSIVLLDNLWMDQNDTLTYYIRDKINGLTSDPAHIFLNAVPQSFDMLDINKINARINATSHHFSRYNHNGPSFAFECPKSSKIYTFEDFDLFITGLDETGRLHLAPAYGSYWNYKYRSGPISSPENCHYKVAWDRVWTVYRTDIENHNKYFQDPGYTIPEPVLNWPGNGDTTIGQAWKLAPFVDQDQDGIYEPYEGDYPVIKGDQSIYFISNDDWGEHPNDSLFWGAEIHGMAYAYDCPDDSVFNYTMFIDYNIINRSPYHYHDVYVGIYSFLNIGSPLDNYSACDTLLDAFYAYNSDNYDSLYWPGYGLYPPAQGITFLSQSLDHFMSFFWSWDWPIIGPYSPMDHYYNLQGKWADGSGLSFGGYGYGGNHACNYQVPGDPSDPDEWSMFSARLDPTKHSSSVGSTGPYTVSPGDTISLELAILFARDHAGDNLSSVTLLKERLKRLRAYYFNDSIPCEQSVSVDEQLENNESLIHIFPNPAHSEINVSYDAQQTMCSILIYDIYGRQVEKVLIPSGQDQLKLDVSGYSTGLYIIALEDGYKYVSKSKLLISR